eukprot:gene7157-2420_t
MLQEAVVGGDSPERKEVLRDMLIKSMRRPTRAPPGGDVAREVARRAVAAAARGPPRGSPLESRSLSASDDKGWLHRQVSAAWEEAARARDEARASVDAARDEAELLRRRLAELERVTVLEREQCHREMLRALWEVQAAERRHAAARDERDRWRTRAQRAEAALARSPAADLA